MNLSVLYHDGEKGDVADEVSDKDTMAPISNTFKL